MREVPHPTKIEVLANLLLGPDADAEPLPVPRYGDVRAALESVLARALARTPCVVSFSGGRDSSAVLAAATAVARSRDLPVPIPAIMRFAQSPLSDEWRWQELVLGHLGLRDAEVIELTGELDALGPAATQVLSRHGLRWPANAYMHRPVLELARGGTLITGIGGDELLSTSSPRRSPRQLAFGALPARVREAVKMRRVAEDRYGWLTTEGRRATRRGLLRDEVSWPYRWDHALHHWYASRAFAAVDGTLALIAADDGVRVVNPLLDRDVLAELAHAGGRRGFPSRTDAMRSLFGELLPDRVLSRPTKAGFAAPVWGQATREFVAAWDGSGVDPLHVDASKLRAELTKPQPDFRTILLLHQAWLHVSESSMSIS